MNSTVDHTENQQSLKDRLAKVYKVVVVDQEDLSQRSSYTGSVGLFLLVLLTGILLTAIITVCLISFTPLRTLMPGYGDIEQNTKYLELKDKITDLEAGVEVQQTYIKGLQQMFAGELDKSKFAEGVIPLEGQQSRAGAVEVSDSDRNSSKASVGLERTHFTSPVLGSISAGYDVSIKHYGVDVLAAKGTAIKAIAPGVLVTSEWSIDSGNTLSIQHGNNTISIYKHNSALLKKVGDYVEAGEAVAIIGNSGTLSDGPHLHFELWYQGVPVDPENYITF